MSLSTHPIVSVVVPMFNVGKYIEQCIDSVLAQTFRHFEILCIDDECSDDTLHKLAKYQDPRIRIIHQKNRGLSGARNTGIQHARGIYVALLDADDFWAPDKLAKHVAHLNANPKVGISYCPSLLVDDDGEAMHIGQFPQLSEVDAKTVFCRNPIGNGSAPVIRRQILLKMNLNDPQQERIMVFDESLRQSEDIELWLRIALNTDWQFEGLSTPMTFYRVNSGGLSANLKKQFASWSLAVEKNRSGHEAFFAHFLNLAKAYQLRYLARRAVQSGSPFTALSLVHKALWTDFRILLEEPKRTLVTYCCAFLALLPQGVFNRLKELGMDYVGQWQQARLEADQLSKPHG